VRGDLLQSSGGELPLRLRLRLIYTATKAPPPVHRCVARLYTPLQKPHHLSTGVCGAGKA